MVDAWLRLGAQRICGPAEQSPEIEFAARCVAQDGDGPVGRRPISWRNLHQLAGAVEGPTEARGARFGLDMTFHFARQSLGSAVRVFLLRPANWLICVWKIHTIHHIMHSRNRIYQTINDRRNAEQPETLAQQQHKTFQPFRHQEFLECKCHIVLYISIKQVVSPSVDAGRILINILVGRGSPLSTIAYISCCRTVAGSFYSKKWTFLAHYWIYLDCLSCAPGRSCESLR